MSNPALAAFDPLATHPFTSMAGARRPAPTRQPVPSPSTAPPPQSAVLSPQPRRPPPTNIQAQGQGQGQGQQQPIFTPFKLERASPELRDVLTKKKDSASAWPPTPPVAGATGKKAS